MTNMTRGHEPLQRRELRLAPIAALALALLTTQASAIELARVEGFGPVSRGFAGGGVAFPVGAAASMLNPAEMLNLEKDQEFVVQLTDVEASITVINSATGENVTNAALGNNRGPYELPEIGYAMRHGDWAFGIGAYAAGGFGIEYGTDSFLSRTTTNSVATGLPVSVRVAQLRIPLSIAWKPVERWRIGASLDVVDASINLATLFDIQQVRMLIQSGRATGSLVPLIQLIPNLSGAHVDFVRNNAISSELAAWGVAGRLGTSFQLTPDTTLAAAYEFQSALGDLKGHGTLTAVDSLNNHIVLPGAGRLPQFQFPQAFVFGVAHWFSPEIAATADLRRTFWHEVFGDTVIAFHSDNGGDLRVNLPTGFNNLTTLTLGAEWQFRPQWTVRGGGSHSFQSTVPNDFVSGTLPTITRNHLAANVSYVSLGGHQFTLGLSYGFTPAMHNPGNNVTSIPPIEDRNRQINPAATYIYHF